MTNSCHNGCYLVEEIVSYILMQTHGCIYIYNAITLNKREMDRVYKNELYSYCQYKAEER